MLSYLMYNYVSPADSAVTVSSYIPSALRVQSGWVGGLSSCGGGGRRIFVGNYKKTCDVTVWVVV